MKILFLVLSLIFSSVSFAVERAPLSVQVITGSYTVPSRKIAKVYVECDSGGIFSINGVNAVTTSPFINIAQSTTANGSLSYSVPANYRAEVVSSTNAVGVWNHIGGGSSTWITTTEQTQIKLSLGPLASISTANQSANKAYSGVAIPSNATNRQANFTLPAGTVLNGTGNWRATVEIYER